MNDLERDLKELFESKAADVQTTPLAPKPVLRRGRRRQVATVVGGALMAVAAAALVIGGASAFLDDRASDPPMGDPDALPARTATIGGVTVTAPEGWSLLDQSLWAMALPTETCTRSFEATGTPVGQGVGQGTGEASDAPVQTPSVEECTPVDMPGGVPLFTLSNAEPNPAQTVCDASEDVARQAVGPTDVYLSVGFDTNQDDGRPEWPTAFGEPTGGPCGNASIIRWSMGGVNYVAVAAIGQDASDDDRDALFAAFEGLGFRGMPSPTTAPVLGFVVAAGVQDDVAWRLDAGASMACESGGACAVQLALITTGPDGAEETWSVSPPTPGSSIVSATHAAGQTTIAFGTAASTVETVELRSRDGTTVVPASVPWPASLQAFASPDATIDGSIWWASVPDVVTVNAVLTDGSTDSSGIGEPSGDPTP